MNNRLREVKVNGISIPFIEFRHEPDDEILLIKIRETKRRNEFVSKEKSTVVSQYGASAGIHVPVDEFEVDEEFSKICSSHLM